MEDENYDSGVCIYKYTSRVGGGMNWNGKQYQIEWHDDIGVLPWIDLNRSHGRVNHNQKVNVWIFNACVCCSMICY